MRSINKPPLRGGPNLLGGMTRLAPDSNRILSNLEHGGMTVAAAPRYRPRGIALLGAGLMLAAAAGLAWLAAQPEPASVPEPGMAPPASYVATARPPPLPHQLQAPPAAAIIDDIAAPAAPAPPHAQLIKVVGSAPMQQHKAPAPRMTKKTAPPWKKTAAPLVVENDVVLLAALVAHASNQPLPEGMVNRDVVLRHDGDATDTLLRRCKQLGLIEGMLCRSRICAGRWDSDQACR